MAADMPQPGTTVEIACRDGTALGGHLWRTSSASPHGLVIINPATGVLARYYHYYARFLAGAGFDVLTYDYRGIGLSRPARLRGCSHVWRDWGRFDFDAALRFADAHRREGRLLVVGHSIGGFLPGFADSAPRIDRMLTVGAQYAWWRDYAPRGRMRLLLRWHVLMPAATALFGYFPGRRLGWLEDLPAGVANEWSFRRARMELSYPKDARAGILASFAAFRAPILAVSVSDDEYGTLAAIRRCLAYYSGAATTAVLLSPADFGLEAVGHFSLFHSRHAGDFWPDTVRWLRDGINPWSAHAVPG